MRNGASAGEQSSSPSAEAPGGQGSTAARRECSAGIAFFSALLFMCAGGVVFTYFDVVTSFLPLVIVLVLVFLTVTWTVYWYKYRKSKRAVSCPETPDSENAPDTERPAPPEENGTVRRAPSPASESALDSNRVAERPERRRSLDLAIVVRDRRGSGLSNSVIRPVYVRPWTVLDCTNSFPCRLISPAGRSPQRNPHQFQAFTSDYVFNPVTVHSPRSLESPCSEYGGRSSGLLILRPEMRYRRERETSSLPGNLTYAHIVPTLPVPPPPDYETAMRTGIRAEIPPPSYNETMNLPKYS